MSNNGKKLAFRVHKREGNISSPKLHHVRNL